MRASFRFSYKEAGGALGSTPPLNSSFSCDFLAASAKEKDLFVSESQARSDTAVGVGSIFLVRRTSTEWTHTGIVTKKPDTAIETIEGNANDAGDREDYEVCRRLRGIARSITSFLHTCYAAYLHHNRLRPRGVGQRVPDPE